MLQFTNKIFKAHAEAFALMYYENKETRKGFVIWNSRDGVTPFTVVEDGIEYSHQHWSMDRYAPNFKLEPGQRYFRDTTLEEAEAFARRRIAIFDDGEFEIKEGSERWASTLTSVTQMFLAAPTMDKAI